MEFLHSSMGLPRPVVDPWPYSPRSLYVQSSSVLYSSDVDVMYSCSVYCSALYIPVQICVLYCVYSFTVYSIPQYIQYGSLCCVVLLCTVVQLLANIPAQRQTDDWLGGMWRHPGPAGCGEQIDLLLILPILEFRNNVTLT